jgi:L-alanine-DL-glutamate epimerase-like enolase superfamily enzyme
MGHPLIRPQQDARTGAHEPLDVMRQLLETAFAEGDPRRLLYDERWNHGSSSPHARESAMKITRITIGHHRLPLDPPFEAAWDSRPRRHFDATIVRVAIDEGLVGIGSGDAMPGFPGHEELFVGQDPRDLERHFRVIDNLSFHYGRCWPLDVALWDLFGKITGQPCWRLLGAASGRVRTYASSGHARAPDELAELAERCLEEGFPAMKVRFSRPDWREEIAGIEAVRRKVGERIVLMVDANQAWRMPWDTRPAPSLKDALELARALEGHGVYWLEEPLHRGDLDGMAALCRASRLRVAGGEMARELHELRLLIERGCLDVLQPDATLIGGLSGLARIGRLAAARGLAFTPHTWGNGIGLLANAHLAAGLGACRYLEFPYDPAGFDIERRDFMLSEPLRTDAAGWLDLPDRPGLGLELDEERLRSTALA